MTVMTEPHLKEKLVASWSKRAKEIDQEARLLIKAGKTAEVIGNIVAEMAATDCALRLRISDLEARIDAVNTRLETPCPRACTDEGST